MRSLELYARLSLSQRLPTVCDRDCLPDLTACLTRPAKTMGTGGGPFDGGTPDVNGWIPPGGTGSEGSDGAAAACQNNLVQV